MIYRALLRLLPRARRARFGDEMTLVFADLFAEALRAGGRRAAIVVWLREVTGMFQFSMREVAARLGRALERLSLGSSGGRWNVPAELRWAWRGVRARGWSAVFVVLLLGSVLAASTLTFSAADSLVFNTLPYRDPDRLVVTAMSARPRLLALRSYTDLFDDVQGYLAGTTFVTGDREPVLLQTTFVTPGLFEMIGVTPQWGRAFIDDDIDAADPPPAVIDYALAIERFGQARTAIGRTLETADRPLLVIGVMPRGFRFPEGRTRIWRVLDYHRYAGSGVVISGFPGVWPVARLARGVTLDHVERSVIARLPEMKPRGDGQAVNPIRFGRPPDARRQTLLALLGASLCLLLTACANVASLELAGAVRRARVYSVQLALGASRAAMARVALLEGALLMGAALVLAGVLAVVGLDALLARLPPTIARGGVNPIDLDWRTAAFMSGVAVIVWFGASLPVLSRTARANLVDLLKVEDRSAAASRAGTLARRVLTVSQVALAVVLLAGGFLYTRTYRALLTLETGMNTTGVVSLSGTLPAQTYAVPGRFEDLVGRVVAAVQSQPGVLRATRFGPAPPSVAFAMRATPEIDGTTVSGDAVALMYNVDAAFFEVLGIPLRAGRYLQPDDAITNAVISDTMARRFWGTSSPLGRTFRIANGFPTYAVVGVVAHARNDRDTRDGPSGTAFTFYAPPQLGSGDPVNLPAPSATPAVNVPAALRNRSFTILARLDSSASLPAILQAARVERGYRVEAEWLDDAYARRHAETLMATQIVVAFSVLAFVVSIAGIYGVMAFLVAGRTREIGIRMALGADRAGVSRMVLGSSTKLVLAGAALGCGAALVASRWIEAQLFGVSPTDPTTYIAVTTAIVVTALLATWQPARQAARVDPAVTLRAE